MRDIINKLEMLQESTGLAGRKPGAVFRNSKGEEIQFQDLKFFPEGGGKYSPEELENAIQEISAQIEGDIQWQNAKSSRTGGFALATFTSPTGTMYIGRYLESIKPSFTDNYVPNQVGDYKYASKAAEKTQAGLTPQDLLTEKKDLTIPSIMNQLAKSLGTDHPLYAVAHRVATGEGLPIEFPAPPGISFSAFRDYFAEILQPMALQTGLYTGNAGQAAEIFLGGSFEGTSITFDDSKTAGLSDSVLKNAEGKEVKVSSKGNKGATASARNLIDSVNELQSNPDSAKLLKKYTDEIDMINEIVSRGQAGAPLYLGVKYGIITEDDAATIQKLKTQPPVNLETVKTSKLSPRLKKLAMERGTDNPQQVNLYYHLIAAVAHKAAEEVNDKTNFSKAAADILNNGALVQVYTKAKEGKDTWTLLNFDTVYPGESIKGVYLSAGKTYYSTAIKGNFTFKIDKGTGKPKETDNELVDAPSVGPDELNDFAAAAKDITEPRRSRVEKPGDVGRKKRK